MPRKNNSHLNTTWEDVPYVIRQRMQHLFVFARNSNLHCSDGLAYLNTYYKVFKHPPYYQVSFTPKETKEQIAFGVSKNRLVAALLGRVCYVDCSLLMHHGPTMWLHHMMSSDDDALRWVENMSEEFTRDCKNPHDEPPRPARAHSPLLGTLPSLAHVVSASYEDLHSSDPCIFRHGLLRVHFDAISIFSSHDRMRMHNAVVKKMVNNVAFKKRVFKFLKVNLGFSSCEGGIHDEYYGKVEDTAKESPVDPFTHTSPFVLASVMYTFLLEPYYKIAGKGVEHSFLNKVEAGSSSLDAHLNAMKSDHALYMDALFKRAWGVAWKEHYAHRAPPTWKALTTKKGRHAY